MSQSNRRLKFGAQKYSALNLVVARWLRSACSETDSYNYITLGGTELLDVMFFNWIDRSLVSETLSYEIIQARFNLAEETAGKIRKHDIDVDIRQDDIFDYQRTDLKPHIFFIDLEGTCKPEPHTKYFRNWLESEVLEPGDFLLITSYLGRNRGWKKTLDQFDAEFRLLRINEFTEKKKVYQNAHPLFILYKALLKSGLNYDIEFNCLGYIKYRDTSTMGLYGVAVGEGRTVFPKLVSSYPILDMTKRDWDKVTFGEN